jgi:exopolysaccharide production protein ExoZ
LGVAIYHALYWSSQGEYAMWGRYFVYFFFVVSGASIYAGYADKIKSGYRLRAFYAARYARIGPLFWAVLVVQSAFLALSGYDHRELLLKGVLNLSLLFGFAAPGATSLLAGGWSLGIEFVFYLLFPLIPLLLNARYLLPATCAALALQLAFVSFAVPDGYIGSSNWVLYSNPVSFGFYFLCGCYIAHLLRQPAGSGRVPFLARALASFAGFAVVGLLAGDRPHVTGLAGVLLPCCVGLSVYCWGRARIRGGLLTRLAVLSGDASYGMYLLHPIVYAVFKRIAWIAHTPTSIRVAALLITTTVLALAIDKHYERPMRRLLQGWLTESSPNALPRTADT